MPEGPMKHESMHGEVRMMHRICHLGAAGLTTLGLVGAAIAATPSDMPQATEKAREQAQ